MNEKIDIVITWVNSNDPKWQEKYYFYLNKTAEKNSSGKQRFEDLNTLKYIFRGIERFLPWVRKVLFVTADQTPEWLNINHPKLNLVSHKDIFPNESYLPTFNSNAIEMCFSNIDGLSEKFIYFNDDTFVIKKINEDRFFYQNKPKDFLALKVLHHDGLFSHGLHSTMEVINKEVKNKKNFILKNFFKIFNIKYGITINLRNFLLLPLTPFSLFEIYHHPQPLLKSILIEAVNKYPLEVNNTRANRFRSPTNVSPYMYRFINLIKGNFMPFYPRDALYVDVKEINELKDQIEGLKNNKTINFVCFNEHPNFNPDDYDAFKKLVRDYLDSILPDKSSYEK